ncbi:MAG: glycosyltransferase [Deltaproteobacteria bacterium]|nr:glycosyltransferase [Deltaproteobacteria bacterium]
MTRHLLVSYHTCPMEEPGEGLSGGMNIFLRGLLRTLGRRGISTDVLTRAAGDTVEVTEPFPGVRIFHVPCVFPDPPTRAGAWESVDAFVGNARLLLRGEGVAPAAVSAHYWMSGVAARRIVDAPMVFSYHTVEARKAPAAGAEEAPLSAVRRREEANLSRAADRVVCFTEHDLAENVRILPDLAGKGVVIPPGVEGRFRRLIPREVARSYAGLPGSGAIFLLAARDDAGKNAGAAMRAFEAVRERWKGKVTLLVAGGAGEASDPSAGVIGLGPVPHEGMPVLFASADVVVCPSLYESFGMVPLEALAGGIPVLVPEGTYWGEKVREEGGGLAYRPDDPEGLSGAMLSLLADPSLRARLSVAGPSVAAPFTWERCTDSWERLLASVSTIRTRP